MCGVVVVLHKTNLKRSERVTPNDLIALSESIIQGFMQTLL